MQAPAIGLRQFSRGMKHHKEVYKRPRKALHGTHHSDPWEGHKK
jgi:hypothetical protein